MNELKASQSKIDELIFGNFNIVIGHKSNSGKFSYCLLLGDNLLATKDNDYQVGDELFGRKLSFIGKVILRKFFK